MAGLTSRFSHNHPQGPADPPERQMFDIRINSRSPGFHSNVSDSDAKCTDTVLIIVSRKSGEGVSSGFK